MWIREWFGETPADAVSRKLVGKLPRRGRLWFGLTPAEAALTDEEIDSLCRVADSYTRRLESLGLLSAARRRRHRRNVVGSRLAVALALAVTVWAGGWRLLDFDGDGRVSVADVHAALDLVAFGRADDLPKMVIDPQGRTRAVLLSHLRRADVPLAFRDDPAAFNRRLLVRAE